MVCPQCGTQNENRGETCIRCKRPLHPALMKGKIPCYIHANREATTSCALCGNRLCTSCAVSVNEIDYCDSCAPAGAVRQDYDEDYESIPVVDTEKVGLSPFDSRFFAGLVDIALMIGVTGIVVLALWLLTGGHLDFLTSSREQPFAYYLLRFLILLCVPLYLFLPVALTGQTIGHRLCGVIVLQPNGQILTTQQALFRTVLQVLSALPFFLGFLWMLWDGENLTWHDRLSGTRVFEYEQNT